MVMKKQFIILLGIVLLGVAATGQERITTKISSGDDLNEVFASSRYLFHEFQEARIILKSGSHFAKMNYNALSGEMEFINDKGEPFLLTNRNDVKAIIIDQRYFTYTPKGYVESLTDRNLDVELVVQRIYQEGERKKIGAFGAASSTTAIGSYSAIETDGGNQLISVTEEVTYKRKSTHYLHFSGKYLIANKSGFKKVFGKQKPNMDNWLKNNPVNFSKEEDLMRLFTYCTE
jgi:hypothetical protein